MRGPYMALNALLWRFGCLTKYKQRVAVVIIVVSLGLGGVLRTYPYPGTAIQGDPTAFADRVHVKDSGIRTFDRSKKPFKTPQPNVSLTELFQTHFPQCSMPVEIIERAHTTKKDSTLADLWISWLNSTDASTYSRIRYQRTPKPPRYDHISCFLMKARYNCAVPPASPRSMDETQFGSKQNEVHESPQASDYQLIWSHPSYGWDRPCDMNEWMDFVGGPAGIYPHLLFDKRQKLLHPKDHRPMIQIMLQGNSYLRQVWEAIVCGFRHQITNLTVLQGGPMLSLAYIQSRRGKLIAKPELGTFMTDQQWSATQQGCHGTGTKTPTEAFYWNTAHANYSTLFPCGDGRNVTVPPNVPGCKDDMAMVEFGNAMQVFFIFHPSRYNEYALVEAYERLGVARSTEDPTQFAVDTMVWTGDTEASMRNLTAGTTLSMERLLPLLVKAQSTSIGQYFGANNPWITHPPDNHPCMPGIPDDQANILLYLLLLDRFIKNGGLT